MMNLANFLNDVFVIHENGYCLFHESYGNSDFKVDGVVISGFLSAIDSFTHNWDSGARKLETDNYRLIYHRREDLIYVARVPRTVDEETIFNFLQEISMKMEKLVPKSLELNGNVEPFKIISQLVYQYFSGIRAPLTMETSLEISGKTLRIKNPYEAKIFSYLRLKGRVKLRKVVEALKIPEEKAMLATKQLMEKELIKVAVS
ncbi:MAG: hypothetical protein D6732_19255 [Methanobacteriota archaeon]|nr:MAG: hypothetical protein D6732_19255 [Euryarchaeota archaeon]